MSERNFIPHHLGGGGLCWHLPERYIELNPDTVTNRRVAIKLLKKPFDVLELAKRTYRELAILSHLRHENVIHLIDAFSNQKSMDEFEDLYLVMPFMPIDLACVLQTDSLDDEQILLFSYQILRGLKYIHGAKILHRDLKPANIIVNEDLDLRIADFGLARNTENLKDNISYVMTRTYRAPEVLTIDIWSAACIFVEMKTRVPLFNDMVKPQHFKHILQITGKPDEIMMKKISSDHSRSYIEDDDVPEKPNLVEIFPWASDELRDLLSRMLELDPDRRLKAAEALEHPYFQTYHDEKNEEVGTPWEDPLLVKNLSTEIEWKEATWNFLKNFEQETLSQPSTSQGPN
ncbi:unnamed protein product [Rodentolepis nana]|uniref:Protein kinase domain-containing protein n=1 Tax=Rodentolepis nana TaxID=102285 RepID=A0A0R3TSW9_RODNA|nr:unnamed protein product [Rodentolepis nana]